MTSCRFSQRGPVIPLLNTYPKSVLTGELFAYSRDTRDPERYWVSRQFASGSLREGLVELVTHLGDPKTTAKSSWPRRELPRVKHRDSVEESSRELGRSSRHCHETPKSPAATARLSSRLSETIDEPAIRLGPEGPSSVHQLGSSLVGVVGLSWNRRRSRGTTVDSLHTPQAPWPSVRWCLERPEGSEEPPGSSTTIIRTATAPPRSTDPSSTPRCRETSRRPNLSPEGRLSSLSPAPDTPKSSFAAEDPYSHPFWSQLSGRGLRHRLRGDGDRHLGVRANSVRSLVDDTDSVFRDPKDPSSFFDIAAEIGEPDHPTNRFIRSEERPRHVGTVDPALWESSVNERPAN